MSENGSDGDEVDDAKLKQMIGSARYGIWFSTFLKPIYYGLVTKRNTILLRQELLTKILIGLTKDIVK